MAFLRRARILANHQLLGGAALGAAAVAAFVAGVEWLAAAALAASLPFLAVGIVLGLSARGTRTRPIS